MELSPGFDTRPARARVALGAHPAHGEAEQAKLDQQRRAWLRRHDTHIVQSKRMRLAKRVELHHPERVRRIGDHTEEAGCGHLPALPGFVETYGHRSFEREHI